MQIAPTDNDKKTVLILQNNAMVYCLTIILFF